MITDTTKLGYFTCSDNFCKVMFKIIYPVEFENEIYCPVCGQCVIECSEEQKQVLDNATERHYR